MRRNVNYTICLQFGYNGAISGFKADKIMIKFKNVIGMCFLFVSVLTSSMTLAQMNTEDRFGLIIEIQGNERVTDGTVLAYLPAQVGDEITLATLEPVYIHFICNQSFQRCFYFP